VYTRVHLFVLCLLMCAFVHFLLTHVCVCSFCAYSCALPRPCRSIQRSEWQVLLDFFQAKRLRVERLREAQAGPGVASARMAAAMDDDDDGGGYRLIPVCKEGVSFWVHTLFCS
jgi:hypothetical protein